jgi:acetyl-CoA C-acetyltransferase
MEDFMNKNRDLPVPVIVGYARTPVGDMLGSLSSFSTVELGAIAAGAAMERAGVDKDLIEEVVCGVVYKAGIKGNPARQIQLKLGCHAIGAASTVDQQCASAMRAYELACDSIRLGRTEICLAVGAESMSNVPHIMLNSRRGAKMGKIVMEDSLLYDALHDAMMNYHMGITAENLAEQYSISRQEQDELALLSHRRAAAARDGGMFDEEIVPVTVKTRKGESIVDKDEHPKTGQTIEELQSLRPAFKPDGGTVTAGNSSGVNDGAAALVLMSEERAKASGFKPIARVLNTASFGVGPEVMGIGPAFAIPKALGQLGLTTDNVDYYEINEAFAAQFIAVNRELHLPMDKVNANGSGIAIGHPVGCTGIRIIIALLQELKRRGKKLGVASLCVGGGPSMATVLELAE